MKDRQQCDAIIGWEEDTSGHPHLVRCPRQAAAFHPKRGPFGFGLFLCEEHKDIGLAH